MIDGNIKRWLDRNHTLPQIGFVYARNSECRWVTRNKCHSFKFHRLFALHFCNFFIFIFNLHWNIIEEKRSATEVQSKSFGMWVCLYSHTYDYDIYIDNFIWFFLRRFSYVKFPFVSDLFAIWNDIDVSFHLFATMPVNFMLFSQFAFFVKRKEAFSLLWVHRHFTAVSKFIPMLIFRH